MAFSPNIELKSGDFTYLNGKKVKVVSTQQGSVVIEDEQGNRHSVRKEALMSTPLFNFYDKEAREKRKEQIAHFQEKAEEAGKAKNDWLSKIKDLWAQMSNLDKTDEQYALLKDEYWAARFSKTAAGNREYSNLMHACMIASDPIFPNQIGLG